jgi:hypothetical protein
MRELQLVPVAVLLGALAPGTGKAQDQPGPEAPRVVFAELVASRGQFDVSATAELLTAALADALAAEPAIRFARGHRIMVDSVLAGGGYMVFGGVAAIQGSIKADVRVLGPDRRGYVLIDSIPAFDSTRTTATYQAARRLAARISAQVTMPR